MEKSHNPAINNDSKPQFSATKKKKKLVRNKANTAERKIAAVGQK